MGRASEIDWTFFAISIQNLTSLSPTKVTVFTNLAKNSELSDFPICFYDVEALFSSIEVNYPMLISPLSIFPAALSDANVQGLFYKLINDMPMRTGPRVQQRERVKQMVPLEKRDYVPKSALVAAPIIFQERKQVAPGGCAIVYSGQWAQSQERKAAEERCTAPYVCDASSGASEIGSAISCPAEFQLDNTTHFGLVSSEFLGRTGFADFLTSMTDNSFVYRSYDSPNTVQINASDEPHMSRGTFMRTADFIDALTSEVTVLLLYFTSQYGITTITSINAQFHGSKSAHVTYEIMHYEILEGTKLILYVFVQSLVLFNIFAMLVDTFFNFRTMYAELKMGIPVYFKNIVVPLIATVLILVYVVLRLSDKLVSASKSASILSDLDQIEWASSDITLASKKGKFFKSVGQLSTLTYREGTTDILCNIILLLNLLCVIQCTSMHPRLNLLLGTLKHAMSDLWHALILVLGLMSFFAGIGNWRFGSRRQDFSTFTSALATEFEMMFGKFSKPNSLTLHPPL